MPQADWIFVQTNAVADTRQLRTGALHEPEQGVPIPPHGFRGIGAQMVEALSSFVGGGNSHRDSGAKTWLCIKGTVSFWSGHVFTTVSVKDCNET